MQTTSFIRSPIRIAQAAGILTGLIGVSALAGWFLRIGALTSLLAGLPHMVPHTALVFVIAGFALWGRSRERASQPLKWAALTAAGVVALAGAAGFCAYFRPRWFPVEVLFFGGAGTTPARPSILTSVSFLFFGSALLLLDVRSRRGRWPLELLAIVPIVISLLAVIGYACGVPSFYGQMRLLPNTVMALPTVVTFLILGFGLLCARPEQGLMLLLRSSTAGGIVSRRLLLAPVLIPMSVGLVTAACARAGFYDAEVAGWAISFVNILSFTGLIWWIALLLDREGRLRNASEEEVRRANASLEQRVLERTAELAQAMERSRWLASFPERNPNPIVEVSLADGAVQYANPFATRAFPELSGEGLRHPWLAGLPGEARPLIAGEVEALRREVVLGEVTYSQSINYVPEGQRLRVYGTDITARKRAEAELMNERNLLRILIDNLPACIYVKDIEGRFLVFNTASVRIAGVGSEADALGRTVHDFFPPEIARSYDEDDRRVLASGRPLFDREEPTQTSDGRPRWFLTTKIPLQDARGPIGLLGISQDITERKQAEALLRETMAREQEMRLLAQASEDRFQQLNRELEQRVRDRTAQLEEANKELEAFSYTVSHDLRAPLRHIQGYVELLREIAAGQLSDQAQRFLRTISHSSLQMGQLIDDLLAFSRMGRVELAEGVVQPNDLVRNVLRELELALAAREIEWQIAELPPVLGDAATLKQVLANLIGNAVKYSRQASPARIVIGCDGERDGRLVFFVRDNGAGFEMAYAHKLFGVFQRLHRSEDFEGTGIGLATVRRIIQRHGGSTWAEGAPGQGATFYFSLKPAPASPPPRPN